MLKKLVKLADFLDSKNLNKEADYLDQIIKKTASGWDWDSEDETSEDAIIRVPVGRRLRELDQHGEEYYQPISPLRVHVPTMKVPIQEDTYDRYFEEPIVEEYDEGVLERRAPFRSDDEDNREYRFNVSNRHTRELGLDMLDFFPGYKGSRDQLLEDLKDKNSKEYSDAMKHFRERITSQDLKANRERRRNREY